MFGDIGHGILMTLGALFLVVKEKPLAPRMSKNEIFQTVFTGRYIILLMGIFSIYTGLIYNDMFSVPLDLFGSSWTLPSTNTTSTIYLSPTKDFDGTPYPFGIDPMWNISENKLTFTNSFKMKMSVILGVMQMTFGLFVSLSNHIFFGNTVSILCEFIPQLLFLLSIFGYLSFLIIYKWCSDLWESNVFPSLLLTLINMFLSPGSVEEDQILIDHQATVQAALVGVALVCVPWMLLAKPIVLYLRHQESNDVEISISRKGSAASLVANDYLEEEEATGQVIDCANKGAGDFDFGDIMVHQSIHTIEFCLGAISNTASYLRLWALSLAHAQLSEVLWSMVFTGGLNANNPVVLFLTFIVWAILTVAVLLIMEGMSAFLHALRLHWVEFQNKFYDGTGIAFTPFSIARLNEDR
eukprot:Nk52_evm13s218 gene=Nk52_evmTU13s218